MKMDACFVQIAKPGLELGMGVCRILFSDTVEQHSVQLTKRKDNHKTGLQRRRRTQ